jgi:hypothetical protein
VGKTVDYTRFRKKVGLEGSGEIRITVENRSFFSTRVEDTRLRSQDWGKLDSARLINGHNIVAVLWVCNTHEGPDEIFLIGCGG